MITMILAGGSGTRLWPYSRTMLPKQFLPLGGEDKSLLQETYLRLKGLTDPERTWVIGSVHHDLELARQMGEVAPGLPSGHLLMEPTPRNTAPAILWGLSQIPQELHDEPVVILPADHLIADEQAFREALKAGMELALEGRLVIFGVSPDRPETGYGYIKAGSAQGRGFLVEAFKEKPDQETAQQYLKEGGYYWNAGIFMGTARTLLRQYREHDPEMYGCFFDGDDPLEALKGGEGAQLAYEEVRSDSFDYVVLERAKEVAMVPMQAGWSDLGSWESLWQLKQKDERGNLAKGDVILEDTKNSLVLGHKKLITCVGVENLIVVDTEDAILVCDLSRSQEIKKLVDRLHLAERTERTHHARVRRPWGSYTVLSEGQGYKIKSIEVLPKKRLSLQRHLHRSEHWVVVEGTAKVTKGKEEFFLYENQSTYIPKTENHRLENPGNVILEIIEVQQGDYLGEDDIQRIEDDFGREA